MTQHKPKKKRRRLKKKVRVFIKRLLWIIVILIALILVVKNWKSCEKQSEPDVIDEWEEFEAPYDSTVVPQYKSIKCNFYGSYVRQFNDLNEIHLSAAKSLNPERLSYKKLDRYMFVKSSRYYRVDSLTHSVPYLLPEAKLLLKDIGMAFQDSLQNRGAGSYKIIATSLLREEEGIKRLRRVNGNASENSAHCYGTTFDVAYNRFERTDMQYTVPPEQLKHLLSEVLKVLQESDRCYVKYEVKQGCFHITVRP